jgi:hypothetical protein
MSDRYDGPVVFVDGVHYAVDKDGHANLKKPLRWEDGGYRAARDDEPLHNDVNHLSDLTLEVGGE